MHNFTDYEKSGAVWMFTLPGWSEEAYRCYSKNMYTRDEALADFTQRYAVKPGDKIIELRAEGNEVKCIQFYSIKNQIAG